jgi:hypothetical protein
MMTSRERVSLALQHKEADRVPLDLGATTVTGMHVSAVYKLRQALALDPPGTPVKVVEPLQMLGEVKLDLVEALGTDTVRLAGTGTSFGFKLEGWKEWRTLDGTPALVPEGFNTIPEPNGDLLMYPQGDRAAQPSGRMPKGGLYFDPIFRQPPIDDDNLNVEDNLEEFGPISDTELSHLFRESVRLSSETRKALVLNLGMLSLGDIAKVPGQMLKAPKGIRSAEEWYISLSTRRAYVYKIFERQTEINLANLERIHQAVGDRPVVAYVTGADFGTQNGPLLAPRIYRELFLPFHKQINDWIHKHTAWKTFIHSCGSVFDLVEDFIAAGFDILNPVQTSAARMEPGELKRKFGEHITFWGGGVDTQSTLPFGSADDVRRQVGERLKQFGPGGGFVFNAVHNIQAQVPVANVLAMYDTALNCGRYPL